MWNGRCPTGLKKLATEAGQKIGDKSKGAHGAAGYSKTTGRGRLLSTSIHTFLVKEGKGKGSSDGEGETQAYSGGRQIPVGGRRRKKIEKAGVPWVTWRTDGTPLLRRKAEKVGIVQPEEEEAPGRP